MSPLIIADSATVNFQSCSFTQKSVERIVSLTFGAMNALTKTRSTHMARINLPSQQQSPEKSKPLLDAVKSKLGSVPNLFRIVGNSPAALEGYLGLFNAL